MTTLNSGMAMDEMGFFVSENLHHDSIRNIFYAPMSFFDTTVCPFLGIMHARY